MKLEVLLDAHAALLEVVSAGSSERMSFERWIRCSEAQVALKRALADEGIDAKIEKESE
jgi:hypothetical protein